jgi:hypothetical protein
MTCVFLQPPAPSPQPPSRHANPFATCWTRPGALPFRFTNRGTAEQLVAKLATQNWRGAIVGPHGSGTNQRCWNRSSPRSPPLADTCDRSHCTTANVAYRENSSTLSKSTKYSPSSTATNNSTGGSACASPIAAAVRASVYSSQRTLQRASPRSFTSRPTARSSHNLSPIYAPRCPQRSHQTTLPLAMPAMVATCVKSFSTSTTVTSRDAARPELTLPQPRRKSRETTSLATQLNSPEFKPAKPNFCEFSCRPTLPQNNIARAMSFFSNLRYIAPLLAYTSSGPVQSPRFLQSSGGRRGWGQVAGRTAPLFQTAKLAQHANPTKFVFTTCS